MEILKYGDMPLDDMKNPVDVDNPELADFSALTKRQREYIQFLRMNPNTPNSEILERLRIPKPTYYRWLSYDENFKRCLYVAYYDVEKYVAARAAELLDEALDTLHNIMLHSNNDNARVSAAKIVLQLPQNPSLSNAPKLSLGRGDKVRQIWERAITYRERLTESPMWEEKEMNQEEMRSPHVVEIDQETLDEIEAKARVLETLEK